MRFFVEGLKDLAIVADRDLALGIEAEPEEPCDGCVVMSAGRVSILNILTLNFWELEECFNHSSTICVYGV